MSKKMIFHLPMEINTDLPSGSQIRPLKMIQAFRNIGYEVELVMGNVKTRKAQIENIKSKIKNGVKYDFLYSESSTMPTALTESHHLPIAPFLDFKFFKFCKNYNIKIGLFYRDIYWKFKNKQSFSKQVDYLKYLFSTYFYKFDLKQYEKLVDIFYLPSKEMFNHIPIKFDLSKVKELPPGIEKKQLKNHILLHNPLSFIYVGGISKLYDLTLFSKVVNQFENIKFNLCTREKDWRINKDYYIKFKSLKVYHLKGEELKGLYLNSDIATYFVKPNIIWRFAMGLKLFEYLSFKKPIIAVKGTAVGEFIEKNDVGWVINFDEKELYDLIKYLISNPQEINSKINNIEKIIPLNTWEARAKKVSSDMGL